MKLEGDEKSWLPDALLAVSKGLEAEAQRCEGYRPDISFGTSLGALHRARGARALRIAAMVIRQQAEEILEPIRPTPQSRIGGRTRNAEAKRAGDAFNRLFKGNGKTK